jgi:hypothetical protein
MGDDAYQRFRTSLSPEQSELLDELEAAGYHLEGLDDEEEAGSAWVPPSIRGEVGTIEGPAIAGTSDRVNAGPAKPGAIEGEVIAPGEGLAPWPAVRPIEAWKPAGEVGIVSGPGASVVEDPKNDAQPIRDRRPRRIERRER